MLCLIKCIRVEETMLWIRAMIAPFVLIYPPVQPFIIIFLKVASRRLLPPCKYCRGVRKCMAALYPTSWSIEEASARWTRKSDYAALLPSLSHRSPLVGLSINPCCIERPSALRFLCNASGWVSAPHVTRQESLTICSITLSHRIANQLSLIMSFFGFLYWGT